MSKQRLADQVRSIIRREVLTEQGIAVIKREETGQMKKYSRKTTKPLEEGGLGE